MKLSDRMARLNRRVFNPFVRAFAGRRLSPVTIVVHHGRKSGRRYRTPVISFRVANGYVVSLPYGADRDWVKNVVAANSCALERGGRRFELTNPTVVAHGEGITLLPALVQVVLRLLRVTDVLRLSTTQS